MIFLSPALGSDHVHVGALGQAALQKVFVGMKTLTARIFNLCLLFKLRITDAFVPVRFRVA